MARYRGAACRLCRRERRKLFLKGDRCEKATCAIERRDFSPGQHGQRRIKISGYGEQLRAKQKVKRIYGILERQFRHHFRKALKEKGITGESLMRILECRLDSVVYTAGFATARAAARQYVNHGHIRVNGRKVDIPSYQVRTGDRIEVRDSEKSRKMIEHVFQGSEQATVPPWIRVNREQLMAEILRMPVRDEIAVPVNEKLIVELYSK